MQGRISTMINPMKLTPPTLWGSWMESIAEDIHPTLLSQFYAETFALAIRFRNESLQLTRANQQQLPQPQPPATFMQQTAFPVPQTGLQVPPTGLQQFAPSQGAQDGVWNTPRTCVPGIGRRHSTDVPDPIDWNGNLTGLSQISDLSFTTLLAATAQDPDVNPDGL